MLLGCICSMSLILSGGVAFFENRSSAKIAAQSAIDMSDARKALSTTQKMNTDFAKQRVAWKDTLLRSGNAESFKKGWDEFAFFDKAFNENVEAVRPFIGRFGITQAAIEDITNKHDKIDKEYRDAYHDMNPSGAASISDPTPHYIADMTVKGLDRPTVDAVYAQVQKIREEAGKQSDADTALIDSALSNATLISVLVSLVSLIGVCVTLVISGRAIIRQIGAEPDLVIAMSDRIANGDLRDVRGEFGDIDAHSVVGSLIKMRQGLHDIVSELHDSATSLSSGAARIKTSSESVSVSATKQTDAGQDMAANIEEMSVSIHHIGESADEAKLTATNSHAAAASGVAVIERMSTEIRHSNTVVQKAADTIASLVGRTKEIEEIVKVVKAIADQTNLLALNAAIEAARAGEQGRGFAVVADEVRKLAEQTASSTGNIERIVNTIRDDAEASSATMKEVSAITHNELALIAETDAAIAKILHAVNGTMSATASIAASLSEQTKATSDIARKVEQISEMSESVSASANDNVAQATMVAETSVKLERVTARFVI